MRKIVFFILCVLLVGAIAWGAILGVPQLMGHPVSDGTQSSTAEDVPSAPAEPASTTPAERATTTTTTTKPTTTTAKPTTTTTVKPTSDATPLGAKKVLDVPILSQFPEYPSGCESVSTVMALRYAGESTSVANFIDNYLPMDDKFYTKDGKWCGPSPYETFVGNPRGTNAYGCMSSVIKKALTAYFGTPGRVKDTGGTTLKELCREYVAKGTPVLTWVTIGMLEIVPTGSWYLSDGTRYTWPGNEHCMVLVGYDETHYYFNDPYRGKLVKYPHWLAEDRYAKIGYQSLVIQ
ncbi:MAG: hypothetical protein E7541_02170 [Ruminococcaceae bacterium]|nr:hypothetical protein [Oscillospiraceae bacterium]